VQALKSGFGWKMMFLLVENTGLQRLLHFVYGANMKKKPQKQSMERAELICPQCRRAAKQWFVDVLESVVIERCPTCGFVRRQKMEKQC
jgi:hypothetical protein